ncbi:MAG TPA: PspA/IM30 family protein [Sphaerochaeta sp.]|nr:PspA/IM30 family protein [Sphaerochaeta sp.]
MGVFSRFLDIVNANINALLDKAEDPEKMIKLMIQEMEDTLIELKSSCAAKMASRTKSERNYQETLEAVERWQQRAELAIAKAREDLAREALLEKRRVSELLDGLKAEVSSYDEIIVVAKDEIRQIEDKLAAVKQKYQMMLERSRRAREERSAQETLRRAADEEASARFNDIEEQIDRMQAANELNRFNSPTLDEQFRDLEEMEEIEAELAELRKRAGRS